MANTFSSDIVPKIIGIAKETLSEEMAFARRLNKDFSGASGRVGDVVSIGVPERAAAVSITPANVAPDGTDIVTTSRNITIDQFSGSKPVRLTTTEAQKYDLTSLMEQQIKESVRQVCYAFNAYCWTQMNYRVPLTAGTAGQSIFNDGSNASIDPLADVYKVLRDNNANPANFDMVISAADEANAKKVQVLQQANTFGTDSVVVDGSAGRVQGFNLFVDQQATSHTIGTITTGLAAKTSTAQAIGTTSLVCTTAASTGACALKKGDPLTVDGESYVLQADATEASAATDVTLSIFPGLKTALTGDEAVTLTTGAGTSSVGVAGDMSGFSAVTRLPETSFLGAAAQGTHIPVMDEKSGATVLLSLYGQFFQGMMQASMVYGADTTDEEKIVRYFSA